MYIFFLRFDFEIQKRKEPLGERGSFWWIKLFITFLENYFDMKSSPGGLLDFIKDKMTEFFLERNVSLELLEKVIEVVFESY